ncbi:MAG: TIGR03986 family CRISPR-associated RAMP protein, partial [Armatimonadota bacterium]
VVQAFQQAVTRAYGQSAKGFGDVPFIKAFLVACKGFKDGLPIHYPRVTRAPDPSGENFEWFVENERQGQYALQDLVKDSGLPIL